MTDEKKIIDPVLSGFYEAIERTNTEKIAHETLAGISEGSSDSESFDVESESEDAENQPWRPSMLSSGNQPLSRGKLKP
jgi:hypothetical protein